MKNIAITVLLSCFLISSAEAKLNLFSPTRYLPELYFYGDSGNKYRLKDFKSDLLLALVWSRHCKPCIGDLHGLNEFARKTANDGIKVILISPAEEWRTNDERHLFLRKFGAPDLVSYLDRKSNFIAGMGIMATPTVILVSKSGREVGQITGSVNWEDPKVINYIIKLKNSII